LELGSFKAPFFPKFLYKNWRKFMSINFEVSKHTFLDGLHLKAEFENGYEVSIVPNTFGFDNGNSNRVELGIFYEGTYISSFSDEDLTFLTLLRAFEICQEVKDLDPNI
jgi:hypothetical protein